MDDITITQAKPENLEAILVLARQTAAAHEAASPPHYNKVATDAHYDTYRNHFSPKLGQKETLLWVLQRGEQVLGHVLVTLNTVPYETGVQDVTATIFDITLAEAERGKGLARRAIDVVTAHLRHSGVTLIRANSWWGNHASDGLFRGRNFTRVVTVYEYRIAEAQPQPAPPKRWPPAGATLQVLGFLLALLAFVALQLWAPWRH